MNTEIVDLRGKITVEEAARYVARHPETIKRWIRSGRLTAHKLGLVWYIDPADLRPVSPSQRN